MENDPMDALTGFYRSLDSVPTPRPRPRPQRPGYRSLLRLAFVPLGAAAAAHLFLAFCKMAPVSPGSISPLRPSIDRYALEELRTKQPQAPPRTRAFLATKRRVVI